MSDLTRLPGPVAEIWDWQRFAACRGLPSETFFHPDNERGPARAARDRAAKQVCAHCPVRRECRTHALSVREPYGVWGGMNEEEREADYLRCRDEARRAAPLRVDRTDPVPA